LRIAMAVESDDLAVEHGRTAMQFGRKRLVQCRKQPEFVAVPGDETADATVNVDERPEPVSSDRKAILDGKVGRVHNRARGEVISLLGMQSD